MVSQSIGIRKLLKVFSSKNTFSPPKIVQRQERVRQTLTRRGWSETAISESLHASWNSLDRGRRSAACVYEQYRCRFAVTAVILPHLRSLKLKYHHATVVSQRWRKPGNRVKESSASALQRKAKDGVERLRKMGLNPIVWGVIELSGGVDQDDNFMWEPHMHLIIGGASREEIRAAFKVRTTKEQRGRLKPVKIMAIDENLGRCVHYGCKFKPELRNTYIGKNGRPHRGKDLLKGRDLRRWTDWMARQPMMSMIIHFGIPNRIIDELKYAELAELVEEMT